MSKRFERKWTDEQIRAVRFDYDGMSAEKVSVITGIPKDTVKAYRLGRRRAKSSGRKQPPRERWKHMKQEELRLFFIEKCKLLLGLYHRMQEKLDETGNYVEPQAAELAIKQPGLAFRRLVPDEAVVDRQPERKPDPPAVIVQGPVGGPEVLPEARRSRPRLTGTTGLLFTRR